MAMNARHVSSAPRCLLQGASVQYPVQGEEEGAEKAIMSGGATGDTAVPAAACYFCGGMAAAVYCRADAAGLCLPGDRHVHGANTVCSRHARAPLCAACRAAPAAVRRLRGRFLCSDCDLEESHHRRGELLEPEPKPPTPLHDRATVDGYTGCPTVAELAAILGLHSCGEKSSVAAADGDGDGDEGWCSVWEEPQVLSLDDVIVPTSCHGLQPLLSLTSSSPKNRSSSCGEMDGEILRQLGELAKSEAAAAAAAYVEVERAGGDQLPPWASSEYGVEHGDCGVLGTDAGYEAAASMAVPACEHEAWIATDCTDVTDAREAEAEAAREQVPASSSEEPNLSSFVEISDIVCPGIDVNGGNHEHPSPMAVAVAPPQAAQPKNGGYDIAYPDRGTVISRYKEKRKNRRFGKQIRYESRKARADGRMRIKGRFAKSS